MSLDKYIEIERFQAKKIIFEAKLAQLKMKVKNTLLQVPPF